jgi:uncharacterized protein involved in outer membrane biogenesis
MVEPRRTPKRRRWPKIIGGLFGILIILVAALYFAVTSEAFLKRFILPRVSDSANADVTVGGASISPFSKVVLRDLKVHPRGAEPLLTAQEVRLKYSLLAIIRGQIKVDEIMLAAPVIELVTHPDGTSNLDPILQSQKKDKKEREPSKEPSEPPNVDLKKLSLLNGTVRQIKQLEGGKRDVTELSGLNIEVVDVRNGQPGKLTLTSSIGMETTNGVLQASTRGEFAFALSPDLKPSSIKGETRIDVQKASGAFAEANGLSSVLVADASPTEVRQLALKFLKANNTLGEIRAEGPFDLATTEGRLNVAVSSIDRQVLSIVGGRMGLDFGKTLINSSNQVELTKAGKIVAVNGVFNVAQFSLQKTNGATPPVDVVANYNVSVDAAGKTAKLQTFAVNGTQQNKRLLQLEVPSPMTITWGEVVVPTGDSALNMAVTDLNMAEWAPFVAADSPLKAGMFNLSAKVTSQESGKQLRLDATTRLDNASIVLATNAINNASVLAHLRGTLTDLVRLKLSDLQVQAAHNGEPVVQLTGTGQYDRQSLNSDLQVSLEANLPRALAMVPQADVKASSGSVSFNGRVQGGQQSQTITGAVALANFTGQLSENRFDKYTAGANLNVQKTDRAIEIRQIAGSASKGPQPGGTFTITGNYATNGVAQLAIKLDGLNGNALEPFLAPLLEGKKLVSVALNGNAELRYDPAGASAVKSDIQVAKLVVSDPEKKIPATPLEAKVQIDGGIDRQVLSLRQARLGLTPTQRAKNELNLSGQLDMSKTNALEGALKVQAESLDLTAYYDLFSGPPTATAPPTPQPGAAPVPPSAAPAKVVETEPPAMQLPVKSLGLDVDIGRLYLRELELASLRAAPKIEGSRLITGPMQLTVNGAPVQATAEVNLGVPGYQYAVSTAIDKMPLEPVVNTFKPEQRGRMKGDLIANVNISGVGTTGPNIKKHLDGQIRFDLTNANVQVASTKFVSNIVAAAAVFLRTPELTESPLQKVNLETKIGSGQVQVSRADFVSALFAMSTGGSIVLENVLTNSTIKNWPLTFLLRRSLADRVRKELLVPGDPGSEYIQLVNIFDVHGIVGDPKLGINEKAIAGAVIEGIGQRVGDENVQKALGAVGGLLGGRRGATNAPSCTNTTVNTNSPATNKPAPFNPFDLLKPKK